MRDRELADIQRSQRRKRLGCERAAVYVGDHGRKIANVAGNIENSWLLGAGMSVTQQFHRVVRHRAPAFKPGKKRRSWDRGSHSAVLF
jgi:hypothetical protein